jgi:predicted transposase YdaD
MTKQCKNKMTIREREEARQKLKAIEKRVKKKKVKKLSVRERSDTLASMIDD